MAQLAQPVYPQPGVGPHGVFANPERYDIGDVMPPGQPGVVMAQPLYATQGGLPNAGVANDDQKKSQIAFSMCFFACCCFLLGCFIPFVGSTDERRGTLFILAWCLWLAPVCLYLLIPEPQRANYQRTKVAAWCSVGSCIGCACVYGIFVAIVLSALNDPNFRRWLCQDLSDEKRHQPPWDKWCNQYGLTDSPSSTGLHMLATTVTHKIKATMGILI